jgi:NAD(P)-dependent dehydrogenase (short-subunit alcohol dehydrogenase family)
MTWNPQAIPSQVGKIFVVTGGNAGIGYFISEQLAAAGGHVIIACRSAVKADAAIAAIHASTPAARLEHVILDLSSYESVRAAAKALGGRRIDAIIENAGSIMRSKQRETTIDGNEVMFGTNHLGHFLLTALLYPTLGATPGSVTSLVAHPGSGSDGLSPKRPGVIDPSARGRILATLFPFVGGGKDRAAWSAVRAATDPDAVGGPYWGPRGGFSGPPVLQKPVASSSSAAFGASLWTASEKLVGQKFSV